MKTKILLLMLTLGFLGCISAQIPQMLDNGFYLMPNPHHIQVKPSIKIDASTLIGAPAKKQPKHSIKRHIDLPTHQVDIVLNYDENLLEASEIRIENNESSFANYDQDLYALQNGSNILEVAEGTYDIIVKFVQVDPNTYIPLKFFYVIREQMAISNDMTINISADEAKNHIHFQTLTINGEPVYTGKYSVDENWDMTLIEPGNTDDVYVQNILLCDEYAISDELGANFGAEVEGLWSSSEPLCDFYVNDVSERYTFYSYRVALKDHSVYTSAYEVQGASGNVTISNDPSKFILFEEPFLVPSREGEELYMSFDHFFRREGAYSMGINTTTFTVPLAEGERCEYYISASTDDSQIGFVPAIQPSVCIKTVEMTPWGEEQEGYNPVMLCMPLVKTNDQIFFANNGTGSRVLYPGPNFSTEPSEVLDWLGRDIKVYPEWPTHPIFSYVVDKKIDNLGNNCPLLVSDAYQYEIAYNWEDEEGNPVSQTFRTMNLNCDYIGRYGERPDYTAQATIKVNGEDYAGPLNNMEALLCGEIEINLTNESVSVDEMTSSNKARLHYNAGSEDENPPTMTMLHFKMGNGDVTDRFSTADEGIVEFSASDFNFILTQQNYGSYNRIALKKVEVSYSPYGEDNWDKLNVEEVPENYWPVMGWFYTGSLAGVTCQGLNGWFDLKIRLTDDAGNWQEQVLSPAFRIDDLAYTSVATITPASKSGDNAIYNLAGQRMRGDLNSLPHGIYIANGKKVVK
jgi:hypothetical protein